MQLNNTSFYILGSFLSKLTKLLVLSNFALALEYLNFIPLKPSLIYRMLLKSFVSKLRDLMYSSVTIDELISFDSSMVTEEYIRSLNLDTKDLSNIQ
jgi:hypothetical protein